jgi:hypothetical protein
MRLALFRTWKDNVPQQVDLTWDEFVTIVLGGGIRGTQATDKSATPAFSPVEYVEGHTRGNDGVISVSAAVLDYDGLPFPEFERLYNAIEGDSWAIYSTFSHNKKYKESGNYSFRLVFPLDRPVPAPLWPDFWARLQTLLPTKSDPSCKDPARIYGLPYAPDPTGGFFLKNTATDTDGNVVALSVDAVMALPAPANVATRGPATGVGKAGAVADSLDPKHVQAEGKRLAKAKDPERAQIGRWVQDVASGNAWTQQQGQRHTSMLLITAAIERAFPTVSIEALTTLWERSVMVVAASDSTYIPDARLQDIYRAYEGARANRLATEQKSEAERTALRKETIKRVRPDGKDDPYTDEDLGELAKLNHVSVGELDRRWIAVADGSFYFLTLDGYQGPYGSAAALAAARDLLSPAPVRLLEESNGKWRPVSLQNLVQRHGFAVTDVIADMTTAKSYVDDHGIIHEAACPVRDLPGRYDPLIDAYLDQVGGRHAGKLRDWCATITRLDRQTCALYLKGVKGTGKTLFTVATARLFRGVQGPVELDRILDNFNEDLKRCPIVAVDEGVSARHRGRATSTELRRLVGSTSRTLARKHRPNAQLRGCIRLVIAANNDSLLQFGEDLTAEDLQAINERFLCIDVGKNVIEWMAANGVTAEKIETEWLGQDLFVRHLLWLKDNHQVQPGKRWLVEGEASEVQARTATSGAIRESVCQWLAGYLEDPRQAQQIVGGLVAVDSDGLWVNNAALLEAWSSYVTEYEGVPTVGRVGRALAGMSIETKDRETIRKQKKAKLKFHRINTDLVFAWASANGHGDVEAMRRTLTMTLVQGGAGPAMSLAQLTQQNATMMQLGVASAQQR